MKILAIIAATVLVGCVKRPHDDPKPATTSSGPTTRDPKGKLSKLDRWAVALYLGIPNKLAGAIAANGPLVDGVRMGDCTKATDPEVKNFCEGNYSALANPDVIALAHGVDVAHCQQIKNSDLQMYCLGSSSKYAHPSFCLSIQNPDMKTLCDGQNMFKDPPPAHEDTAAEPPPQNAPANRPHPACKPNGSVVRDGSECCSGASVYATGTGVGDMRKCQ